LLHIVPQRHRGEHAIWLSRQLHNRCTSRGALSLLRTRGTFDPGGGILHWTAALGDCWAWLPAAPIKGYRRALSGAHPALFEEFDRHENRSLCRPMGQTLGDPMVAAAMLDRLRYRASCPNLAARVIGCAHRGAQREASWGGDDNAGELVSTPTDQPINEEISLIEFKKFRRLSARWLARDPR